MVAAFQHIIGTPGCHDLGVGFMFAAQQVGGSPDVAISDHSDSIRSAAFLPSATWFQLDFRVFIAPKNTAR
jgi:hypothetical protein